MTLAEHRCPTGQCTSPVSVLLADAGLGATETEINAAPWAHVALEGLYILYILAI